MKLPYQNPGPNEDVVFIRWVFITIILCVGDPDLLDVIVQFIGNTCK